MGLVESVGLKLHAVLSFHSCGANRDDDYHVPLPAGSSRRWRAIPRIVIRRPRGLQIRRVPLPLGRPRAHAHVLGLRRHIPRASAHALELLPRLDVLLPRRLRPQAWHDHHRGAGRLRAVRRAPVPRICHVPRMELPRRRRVSVLRPTRARFSRGGGGGCGTPGVGQRRTARRRVVQQPTGRNWIFRQWTRLHQATRPTALHVAVHDPPRRAGLAHPRGQSEPRGRIHHDGAAVQFRRQLRRWWHSAAGYGGIGAAAPNTPANDDQPGERAASTT